MNLSLEVHALAASPEHAVRILRHIADDIEQKDRRAIGGLELPQAAVVSGSVTYDWKIAGRDGTP